MTSGIRLPPEPAPMPRVVDWTVLPAVELSGSMIGRLIRVRTWDANTEISIVTTGDLRQINQTVGDVWIHIGVGAEYEIRLDPGQPVSLNPPADYADVWQLAEYDKRSSR